MSALEGMVLERIRTYAADWSAPGKMELPEPEDPAIQRQQAKDSELRRLKQDVEKRNRAVRELYLDKASGLIDATQFAAMQEAFLQEIRQEEKRIRILETELERQKKGADTAVQTRRETVQELLQIPHLTRELAVLLVDKIIVGPKDPLSGEQNITIEWDF